LGKVLVDLIPKIYDTERVVRILGKDGAQKIIKINSEQPNEDGKIFDVRNGKYDIYVDTGPSFASQRKENAEALTTLLGVLPPEKGTAIAHLAVENMDWEGAKEASRILKRMMPPELLQDDNEDVSKEQIAAQAQSLQGENEQLKAQIDDLNKLLLSNQQKIDADKEMTLFKEQEETKRLLIKNNATLDQIEKKNQGEINKILVEGMAKISDSMSALEHKLTKITGENREEADDAD
jgi:hypothetical protein